MNRHIAAIRSGRIDKSNLIGMQKALNALARYARGYSISATAPRAATNGEAQEFEPYVEAYEPLVTGALHDSGVKLLRSPRWRKRFNETQHAIIASSRLRFHLIRFDWINSLHCVPVYRATNGGDSFAFRNIPWQSAWAYGLESGPTVESES